MSVLCVCVCFANACERESEKKMIEMFKRKGLLARDRFPLLCSSILPPSSLPPSFPPSLPLHHPSNPPFLRRVTKAKRDRRER